MKLLLLTSILTGFISTAINNVEKIGRLIDQSKVSYNITEDKMLEGSYVIKDVKDVTRLRGSYTKDKRTGNWYCFDSAGNMVLRYNYDLKKLVSLEEKQYDGYTIKVVDKDPEVAKNASIPVPICSLDQLKSIIEAELKDGMPAKLKAEGGPVKAEITVKINELGQAKYFAKYVFKELSYTTMIFVKDKVFNIEWLPATYKDKTYKSEISFASEFNLEPGDHKRFIWNQ